MSFFKTAWSLDRTAKTTQILFHLTFILNLLWKVVTMLLL